VPLKHSGGLTASGPREHGNGGAAAADCGGLVDFDAIGPGLDVFGARGARHTLVPAVLYVEWALYFEKSRSVGSSRSRGVLYRARWFNHQQYGRHGGLLSAASRIRTGYHH